MNTPTSIKECLSDVDGSLSSKRVITFIGIILFAIGYLCNLFFQMQVESTYLNILASIILAGLGVTVAERFGKKFTSADETVLTHTAPPMINSSRLSLPEHD